MGMATLSDQVRDYVYRNYIVPARENNTASVTVTAGDVHRALKFYRRMSLVCAALNTTKFERQYGIRLLERTGSGHGPTATFTFSVHSAGERNPGSSLLGGTHGVRTT